MGIRFAAPGERPETERFFLHPITTKERVMEPQRTDLHALDDYELNQTLERDEELDGLSIQQQRLARIQEYEELALARRDPFAAILGMGTCYLAQVFEHLGKKLWDELESQPPTLTALREVSPEIRLLLKVRSAMETDLEFQEHVRGEQPMALSGPTKNGALKQAVRRQRGVVSHRPRSND
jgi:hypothetical protein